METKTAAPIEPSTPPTTAVVPDDDDVPVATIPPVRGLLWASNLGWVVAGLGIAIIIYTFYWQVLNEPDTFAPGGVNGFYLGVGIFVIGLVAGITFILVPLAAEKAPVVDARGWAERAEQSRTQWMTHRVLSYVGVALFLIGLAFTAWVYRENVAGGSETEALTVAGASATFTQWATVGLLLAISGILLWTFSGLQAGLHRKAVAGYGAAARVPTHPAPAPVAPAPAPVVAPVPATGVPGPRGVLSNGVNEAEVRALMRRLDQMMATLPEEAVASFSKSPEAATYLKLLADKKV